MLYEKQNFDTTLTLKHRSKEFCWQNLDTTLILKHRSSHSAVIRVYTFCPAISIHRIQLLDTALILKHRSNREFLSLHCSIVSKTDVSFVRQHVYLFACLRHFSQILFCNLSLHILQSAYKFLTPRLSVCMFTCLSACVISQKLAITPVIETAKKTPSLRFENSKIVNAFDRFNVRCSFLTKFENSSMHLIVSMSDAALWQNSKIRQCIWLFQCQVQFFDKIRKSVNAFNRFSVECNLLTILSNHQSTFRLATQSTFWSTLQVNISTNVFHQQT